MNQKYREDFSPVESDCNCYACKNYTKGYLAHLFRSKEMLAGTLSSIHNLYFIIHLVDQMRVALLDGSFEEFKNGFIGRY